MPMARIVLAKVALMVGLSGCAATALAQPSYTEVTPGGNAASASTNDGNLPANTLDNDLGTRWSGQGDGHWLQYDLGASHVVAYLTIASYSGNTRRARFDIQVSDDGATWNTVWVGQSSGATTAQEMYEIADVSARYIRLLGHGNSANAWNSFTEVDVFASSGTPEPPTPPPPATPTPTPTNTPTPSPTPGPPTPSPTPMPNIGACMPLFNTADPATRWAHYDLTGALTYETLDGRGDRIMDFSHAGYKGGGVALPIVPPTLTLAPTASGDDTPRIQAAIDQVAALPLDPTTGLRGAVRLEAGEYRIDGTLNLTVSGVVLRGAGSGEGGTVLHLTGSPHKALNLAGSGSRTLGMPVTITDVYVPSGTRTLNLSSVTGLAVGERVLVRRRATSAWIEFMQMHDLVRNGAPQTWISAGSTFTTDRRIVAIAGNEITLDAPVSDSFDGTWLGLPVGDVVPFTFPGRIAQVGVEDLAVIAPPQSVPINQPNYKLLSVDAVEDAWVKNVYARDCGSGASVGDAARRITFDGVTLDHTLPANTSAGAPGDFGISGTQTLLMRCRSLNARSVFYALTQGTDIGPIVFLDFQASNGTAIQPHQRWATGLLVDRARLASGAIELENRGNLGSGHGWTMGWGVSWNSVANSFAIQQPPGTTNWAIGNKGGITDRPRYGTTAPNMPRGAFDSHGTFVQPTSLYLAQLCDRLGPQALANIGYSDLTPPSLPTGTPPTGTPTPTPSPTPTPVGFTFEAETLPFTTSGPTNVSGADPLASAGVWMAFGATSVGAWVEYTLPDVPRGTYDLRFKYKTNPNRGIHNVALDGVVIGGTIDQYRTGAGTFPEVTMGTVRFDTAGPHVVRLTVVDKRPAAGNHTIASDRFVLLADAKAPVVTAGDVEAEATGPYGAAVSFSATAVDDKDGPVNVTFDPPSGSLFPLGASTVSASAADFAGNVGTATFQVNVVDTTPPALNVPEDLRAEATGPDGAVVHFTATAHDLVAGDVPVSFDFASGSTFGLGRTIVRASATDGAENDASAAFVIEVVDTTPPALTLPGPLLFEATSAAGAAATYTASATDLVSGAVPVLLSPPSGSTLALGTHTVTAAATDAAGNTAAGSFAVKVVDTTAPAITAPPDVTITTCSRPDIGQPTVTDAVGTPTVTNDAPFLFVLGTRVVTWRAVDGAGNVATATQRVTVELGDDATCCPVGTKVILGTSRSDVLRGTSRSDCILGRGGEDVIRALGGNDFISGGEGHDQIDAGTGHDVVFGGLDTDIIDASLGNDRVYGGPGVDVIAAGPGSDTIDGGPEYDVCFVPPDGHDVVTGCP
jgi:Ca2+-binding RTX toxin-like protein